MSRWIVPLVLAIAVSARGKEIVVRGPELSFTCVVEPSVDALAACIKQHGWTYKLAQPIERAKLVEVNAPVDPFDMSASTLSSLAIYVPNGKGVMLGGLYQPQGAYEVLGVQAVTVNHTHGFRFDVGVTRGASLPRPDGTSIPGIWRTTHAVFCAGTSPNCTDITTSCDWISEGHEVYSFHGELHLDQRTVRVTGDDRFAAPMCNGGFEMPLAWP